MSNEKETSRESSTLIPTYLNSAHFHNLLCVIWNFSPIKYTDLMLYVRDSRKTTVINIQQVKDSRMISYYMALWLLEHHEDIFIRNSKVLIEDLGYFKDCLNMARIAKDRRMTDHQINIILYPMAAALISDEAKIIQAQSGNKETQLKLSLAHKWAPRHGKAFAEFIPYLRKLCNINGPNPQEQWRKYIRAIAQKNITVENLLSAREFDKINFLAVPRLAFNLYKDRFAEFIKPQ